MSQRRFLNLLALVPTCFASASAAIPSLDWVEGEVVVTYHRGYETTGKALLTLQGYQVTPACPRLGSDLVRSGDGTPSLGLQQRFSGVPWLKGVDLNSIAHVRFIPNDSRWSEQWGPVKMECPAAWDFTHGLASTTIALVDTGVSTGHPDLVGKTVAGWNVFGNSTDTDDRHGHGTVMAGIAVAGTNNGLGIAGVGFDCKVQPIRVTNDGGSATMSDLAEGIVWAADHGAKVILIGLTTTIDSTLLRSATDYAWNAGKVVIAPAGSSGSPNYPSYYRSCMAVAASDSSDNKASFSNSGPEVDVAAPGVNVLVTTLPNGYSYYSGTSMSAAHVAGVAALVSAFRHNLATNVEIRKRIERGSDKVSYVEFGRVNARKSLALSYQERQGNSLGD